MVQTPIPADEELSAFYPADYHSFGASGLLARLKDHARLRRLQSLAGSDRAVLLDYGCGDGRFIKEAASRTSGWVYWGFEMASRLEKYVAPDGRVTIIRGKLEDLLTVLPRCNVITMNHVIEHLPDPLAVLTALSGRMTEGGIMEGQTPAADSLERKLFQTRWSGFHAPRHTVVFSRNGLRQILTRAGFFDPEVTPAFNPAAIAVSLASLSHGDNPGRIRRQGAGWLTYVAAASLLHPIERLSGSPGIVNYAARKP
ncbi:MAG TPA: class I SAM-dependent methyltransferase [Vicinamibacterales bacterium]|nr:class I SAM-dependent methyltransferase [Vicinamibacterales bacterium]